MTVSILVLKLCYRFKTNIDTSTKDKFVTNKPGALRCGVTAATPSPSSSKSKSLLPAWGAACGTGAAVTTLSGVGGRRPGFFHTSSTIVMESMLWPEVGIRQF